MESPNVESAEFGIRLVARLIDYALMFAMLAVAFAVLGMIASVVDNPDSHFASSILSTAYVRVSMVVAMTLYHTFAESVGGATLGKRLLGLEVLSEELRPATLLQTWKRSLGFLVDSFFFGLIGYNAMQKTPERQRLGDRYGETRVVRRRSLPAALRRPTRVFVFVLFGAFGIGVESVVLIQFIGTWLFA